MPLVLHKKWRQPKYPKSLKILSIEIKMEALKKDKEITKKCQRMVADVQIFLCIKLSWQKTINDGCVSILCHITWKKWSFFKEAVIFSAELKTSAL